MLSDKILEEYLTRDDWPYERLDNNTWRSGFRGENSNFRFFIRLTESWVFFTIVPFVPTKKGQVDHKLYKRLLELNREINLAKFALDDDSDVVLTVEMPSEGIGFSEFKDALDALSFYADRYYLEILSFTQNNTLN